MLKTLENLNRVLIVLNKLLSAEQTKEESIDVILDELSNGVITINVTGKALDTKGLTNTLKSYSAMVSDKSSQEVSINLTSPSSENEHDIAIQYLIDDLRSFTKFFSTQVKVTFHDSTIALNNGVMPLWRKDSSETTTKEYINFYKSLYLEDESEEVPPWLYVKIYEPLKVEGIIFFNKFNPYKVLKSNHNVEILLEQATVSESFLSDCLPDFFEEAFGILEIKDISYEEAKNLRNTDVVKKVSDEIVLNIAASIRRLERKNRAEYEKLWPNICHFVKKACLSNDGFDKIMRPHILFKTLDKNLQTLNEILVGNERSQPQKVFYYDKGCIHPDILSIAQKLKLKSIEIDSFLDPLFIQFEESSVLVGQYLVAFISLEEALIEFGKVNEDSSTEIKPIIYDYFQEKKADDSNHVRGKLNIEIRSFKEEIPEIFFLIEEASRRAFYNTRFTVGIDTWPINMTAVINSEHPKIKNICALSKESRREQLDLLCLMAKKHIWPQVPEPSLEG